MKSSKISIRFFAFLGAAIAFAGIGGCASMSKDECMTVDWRTVGYEDGVAGRSGARIADRRKACAKYGVAPDLTAYQNGRDQGLREFCRPQNGFHVGSRGNSYNGVCPADLEPAFLGAYETGCELYSLRSRVSDTANHIDSLHAENANIDDGLVRMAAEMINSDTSNERRAQLILETKRMAERKGEIRVEIPQLQADLMHYQHDLAEFRSRLAYVE
jgi:Protein of unknown function (DUF2799)